MYNLLYGCLLKNDHGLERISILAMEKLEMWINKEEGGDAGNPKRMVEGHE